MEINEYVLNYINTNVHLLEQWHNHNNAPCHVLIIIRTLKDELFLSQNINEKLSTTFNKIKKILDEINRVDIILNINEIHNIEWFNFKAKNYEFIKQLKMRILYSVLGDLLNQQDKDVIMQNIFNLTNNI